MNNIENDPQQENIDSELRQLTEDLLRLGEHAIAEIESDPTVGTKFLTASICLNAAVNKLNKPGEEDSITIDSDLRATHDAVDEALQAKFGEEGYNEMLQQILATLPHDFKDTITINTVKNITREWEDRNGNKRFSVETWMIPSQEELTGYSIINPIHKFTSYEEALQKTRGTGSVIEVSEKGETYWVVYKRERDHHNDGTTPRSYLMYDPGVDSMDDAVARLPGFMVDEVGRYNNTTKERLPSKRLGQSAEEYLGWK